MAYAAHVLGSHALGTVTIGALTLISEEQGQTQSDLVADSITVFAPIAGMAILSQPNVFAAEAIVTLSPVIPIVQAIEHQKLTTSNIALQVPAMAETQITQKQALTTDIIITGGVAISAVNITGHQDLMAGDLEAVIFDIAGGDLAQVISLSATKLDSSPGEIEPTQLGQVFTLNALSQLTAPPMMAASLLRQQQDMLGGSIVVPPISISASLFNLAGVTRPANVTLYPRRESRVVSVGVTTTNNPSRN